VRLADPEGGVIAPDTFLPLAAELGLMGRLTDQVLRQACSAASSWLAAGHDIRVAFNAPPQWLDASAVERIEATIAHYGIPNSAITVEVTEEETLSAGRAAIDALAALRSAGIHVAIDDFGTGYAGLDSFRSVPADIVKIDRSFIEEMMHNPEDSELVRSMLELVYRFGKRAVAEGVETQEQFVALGKMGCDYAQGFLLSRPVPLADFPFGLLLPTSPPA
jgi:diguanylate cyclase